MEALGILLGVAVTLFFLIGVPWLAVSGWRRAKAAQAAVEPLTERIGRLQHQLDALRTELRGGPAAAPKRRKAEPVVSETAVAEPVAAAAVDPVPAEPVQSVMPGPAVASSVPPSPQPEAPKKDFEELIGTRWAIWVGGAALALGALFLVRFTIEAGFFGPLARLVLAAAFSGALIWTGEALRRGAVLPRRFAGALPPEHAPLALAAAGTVGLFGTVYAAHALYGYIPQSAAFVLLGLIGIAAMAASLLHGQALAGLGLVGSYATPLLIGGESASRWPLAIFLLVVTAAGLALDRRIRSLWLGWAVVGGVALWTGLLILAQTRTPVAELAFMVISLALFAAFFCCLRPPKRPETVLGDPAALTALAGLAAAIGLSFVVHAGSPQSHAFFALAAVLIAGLTAARDGRAAFAAVAAALLPLGMILCWPSPIENAMLHLRVIDGAMLVVTAPPRASLVLAAFALAAAFAAALPPLARFLRRLPTDGRHSSAGLMTVALASGLAAPLIAFAWAIRSNGLAQNLPAAAILLALTAALGFATERLLRQSGEGRTLREAEIGAGGYGAGAALALGLAIALAMPGLWMAFGFAAAALAVAALNDRRPLPMLRRVAAAFATTAVLRAILAPVFQSEGAWPILNTYILAYGLPAVLLAGAALVLRRRGRDRNLATTGAMAGLMAAIFLAYEIRHAFHGADLVDGWRFGLGESGLYVLVCIGAALGLTLARERITGDDPARLKTAILGVNGVGLALLVLLALVAANPWWSGRISGPVLIDSAFVGFLLPALALGWLAYLGRTEPAWFVPAQTMANRGFAIALGYLYLLAETRRLFVGSARFIAAYTGDAEQWAYSLVTLGYGVALLAIGFRLGSRPTRLASAVFVILAVLKVFLVDMAELTGLLRALSFIGLGAVLIGIGLAYQRLLFDRRPTPAPSNPLPEGERAG